MNRVTLARRYETSDKPWRTYLVEAHAGCEITAFLADAFQGATVTATDDAFMSSVRVPSAMGPVDMIIDHLDRRYLSVHTTDPVALVRSALHRTIDTNRDLDWVWLPAGQMRIFEDQHASIVSPQLVGGTVVDEDFGGHVNEADPEGPVRVHRDQLRAASGDRGSCAGQICGID